MDVAMPGKPATSKYTCNDYRAEMILLGLQRRLAAGGLNDEEKARLLKEIAAVEKKMGID